MKTRQDQQSSVSLVNPCQHPTSLECDMSALTNCLSCGIQLHPAKAYKSRHMCFLLHTRLYHNIQKMFKMSLPQENNLAGVVSSYVSLRVGLISSMAQCCASIDASPNILFLATTYLDLVAHKHYIVPEQYQLYALTSVFLAIKAHELDIKIVPLAVLIQQYPPDGLQHISDLEQEIKRVETIMAQCLQWKLFRISAYEVLCFYLSQGILYGDDNIQGRPIEEEQVESMLSWLDQHCYQIVLKIIRERQFYRVNAVLLGSALAAYLRHRLALAHPWRPEMQELFKIEYQQIRQLYQDIKNTLDTDQLSREVDNERVRAKEAQQEMEKEKIKQQERERERIKEQERERERERMKEKERERERIKEQERERERERMKEKEEMNNKKTTMELPPERNLNYELERVTAQLPSHAIEQQNKQIKRLCEQHEQIKQQLQSMQQGGIKDQYKKQPAHKYLFKSEKTRKFCSIYDLSSVAQKAPPAVPRVPSQNKQIQKKHHVSDYEDKSSVQSAYKRQVIQQLQGLQNKFISNKQYVLSQQPSTHSLSQMSMQSQSNKQLPEVDVYQIQNNPYYKKISKPSQPSHESFSRQYSLQEIQYKQPAFFQPRQSTSNLHPELPVYQNRSYHHEPIKDITGRMTNRPEPQGLYQAVTTKMGKPSLPQGSILYWPKKSRVDMPFK